VECKQKVPDFLEEYRPGNDELDFDDNSEDEFFDTGDGDADLDAKSDAGSEARSAALEADENQAAHDFGTDDFADEPVTKSSTKGKGGLGQSVWASAGKNVEDDFFWNTPSKKGDSGW
jgi:ATP-dependent RNA helicase DDX3X